MRILDVDELAPGELREFSEHLLPHEPLLAGFRAAATTILFSDRRIVTVQRHMLLDERLETSSFSWRSLRHFSLRGASESARSEIKITLAADAHSLHLRANPGTDFHALYRLLAEKLL